MDERTLVRGRRRDKVLRRTKCEGDRGGARGHGAFWEQRQGHGRLQHLCAPAASPVCILEDTDAGGRCCYLSFVGS